MPAPIFLAPIISAAFSWLFRTAVIKFVILAICFEASTFLIPKIVGYLLPFTGTGGIDGMFANIPPSVWYFLDLFQLGYALPVVLSAYIARFLIRRIPFIG